MTWADDTRQFCTSTQCVKAFCYITAICGNFVDIEPGVVFKQNNIKMPNIKS